MQKSKSKSKRSREKLAFRKAFQHQKKRSQKKCNNETQEQQQQQVCEIEIPRPCNYTTELDFTNGLCEYLEYVLMPHHTKRADCKASTRNDGTRRNLVLTVAHLLYQCRGDSDLSSLQWENHYKRFLMRFQSISKTYMYQAPEIVSESWERTTHEIIHLYSKHPQEDIRQKAALIWSHQES